MLCESSSVFDTVARTSRPLVVEDGADHGGSVCWWPGGGQRGTADLGGTIDVRLCSQQRLHHSALPVQ